MRDATPTGSSLSTTLGAASAREVRRRAQSQRRDVQKATQRFALERFLHRVFTGPRERAFVLKGGMLMMAAEGAPDQYAARGTSDVDIQAPGHGGGADGFGAMLAEALSRVPDPDDGVRFDVDGLRLDTIRERVPGCAVSVAAHVGTVKVRIKCDATFDERTRLDETVEDEMPSMLPGLAPVRVRRIPWEHVVADKVQSLCRHGPVTYRLRDYYDLYVILGRPGGVDPVETARAMARTFAVFGAEPPADVDAIEALCDDAARTLAEPWARETAARRFHVPTPPLPEMFSAIREGVREAVSLTAAPATPAPF